MTQSIANCLSLSGLVIGHQGRAIAGPLTHSFDGGRVYMLTGPNGGGKTTLLRTILGLEAQLAGTVRFPKAWSRAYVPQSFPFDDSLPTTVFEMVRAGSRTASNRKRAAVLERLERVGLEGVAAARFARLSGGQQQRVLLARALGGAPDFLGLDEPTSGVDEESRRLIWRELTIEARERNTLILIVTHDEPQSEEAAPRRLLLTQGALREVTGP